MSTLSIFNRKFKLPQQRWLRIVLGLLFIVAGTFGFLPILGFWMIPLGFVILSMDLASVRRFRRKIALRWARWKQSNSP